jgi:hypothetical protein
MIAERASTGFAIAATAIAVVTTSAMGFERGHTISWQAVAVEIDARTTLARVEASLANPRIVRGCPPDPGPQEAQAIARVDAALGDLDGCFEEWTARQPAFEADLTIAVDIDHYGNALAHTDHDLYGGVLAMCLETAMERVRFPAGPEDLDLEVHVQWSEGLLNLAPIVVGHREPTTHQLPRSRNEQIERAKAQLRRLEARRAELEWRLEVARCEYARQHAAP